MLLRPSVPPDDRDFPGVRTPQPGLVGGRLAGAGALSADGRGERTRQGQRKDRPQALYLSLSPPFFLMGEGRRGRNYAVLWRAAFHISTLLP